MSKQFSTKTPLTAARSEAPLRLLWARDHLWNRKVIEDLLAIEIVYRTNLLSGPANEAVSNSCCVLVLGTVNQRDFGHGGEC